MPHSAQEVWPFTALYYILSKLSQIHIRGHERIYPPYATATQKLDQLMASHPSIDNFAPRFARKKGPYGRPVPVISKSESLRYWASDQIRGCLPIHPLFDIVGQRHFAPLMER